MYVVLICIMLKSSSTSFGKLLQFVSNILLCFSVSVVSSFFFFFLQEVHGFTYFASYSVLVHCIT